MPESAQRDVLDPEDEKIVTLARSARARTRSAEGAAVRDSDGRTYAACTITLPSFQLTAMQAAVAAAVSSGADELEAAAVVSEEPIAREACVQAVRDLGALAPIVRADPAGNVREVLG